MDTDAEVMITSFLDPALALPLSFICVLVTYREQIPAAGPPSFQGRLIRYTYKLTVGAKRLQHPSQITRIPIRVILIPGEPKVSFPLC